MNAGLHSGTGPGFGSGDAPPSHPAGQLGAAGQDGPAAPPRPTFTPHPAVQPPVNHLDVPGAWRPRWIPLAGAEQAGRPVARRPDARPGDDMQRGRDTSPSGWPDFTAVRDHVAKLGVDKPPVSPGALREAAATWQASSAELTVGATRQDAGDQGAPRPKGTSRDSSTLTGHAPRTPPPYAPRHAVTEQRATPPGGTRVVPDQPTSPSSLPDEGKLSRMERSRWRAESLEVPGDLTDSAQQQWDTGKHIMDAMHPRGQAMRGAPDFPSVTSPAADHPGLGDTASSGVALTIVLIEAGRKLQAMLSHGEKG